MKERTAKYLPFLLILIGGGNLVRELYPHRFGFLSGAWLEHHSWMFWILGMTGVIWLILRRMPETAPQECPGEKAGFFRKYGIEIMILLVTAASLSMLIRSGFFWDDARNSTRYLAEKRDAIPTLTHVLKFMRTYLRLGRINVLSVYYYFFFYIENVSVYKGLIIALILINQLIFRKVLTEFDVPLSGARLGMLLMPLMLQTRAYQDPVSGFYGLMQILTAEMLLCAFFLSRWMRNGRFRELLFSLLCFAAGMMTYEVCFPFLAMICVLIWAHRRNFLRAVRDSLPFVGLVLLMLAAVFAVRRTFGAHSTYAGVAFSLDPARILRAAVTQIRAGLPLSYYSAGYLSAVLNRVYPAASFMNYDFRSFLSGVSLTDLLILAVCVISLTKIRAVFPRAEGKMPELALLGASFAILPVITVAMSKRYQGQLMPGLGYLPVYMQYYGIAMLLLWLLLHLKPSAGLHAFCLSAFGVILLLNLQNNRAVTEILNRSFYAPRMAGEAALHGGILDFLPEDAVLVSDNDRLYLWEADWNNHGLYRQFYGNNSRRIPESVGDYKLLRGMVDDALADNTVPDSDGFIPLHPENVWVITYNGGPDRGLARLGRVRSALISTKNYAIKDVITDRVLYFISGQYPDQAGIQYSASDGSFVTVGSDSGYQVRRSDEGILYQLAEDEEILFSSLNTNLTAR